MMNDRVLHSRVISRKKPRDVTLVFISCRFHSRFHAIYRLSQHRLLSRQKRIQGGKERLKNVGKKGKRERIQNGER